jgi:hypothetical protein
MFKASDYGLPKPPLANTVMVQKQEMVSAKFGTPLFREYDHDGLLLDLFGSYCKDDGFEVQEVSITGTRFSVLKLVEGCRDENLKYSLLEEMTKWCEIEHEKEIESADTDARIDAHERHVSHMYDLGRDLEGRN